MGARWDDTADARLRSWAQQQRTIHGEHAAQGITCRNCPEEVERRIRLAQRPATWDVWLLAMLFGPGTLPTRRGLRVARAALALVTLLAAALLALLLGGLADAVVDPSPVLPEGGRRA